jgi:formylglycine-generating enzyme required for sulfatase activity
LGTDIEITNSIGMTLALIPPGEFDMGSSEDEIKRVLGREHEGDWHPTYIDRVGSEGPRHRVKMTRPFYIGTYEVTQAEYEKVMEVNPSHFSAADEGRDKLDSPDTGDFPVEMVAWSDALEFCRRLSALPDEKEAERHYRLPTEAEWEYACRAGSASSYCFGGDEAKLPEYAWMRVNSDGSSRAVGTRKPNAWGLHDMHGNLWEWCADWYHNKYYGQSPEANPPGPQSGSWTVPNDPSSRIARVVRGGAWTDANPDWFRNAARSPSGRGDSGSSRYGFRVVCVIDGD